jgi:hypothetical protein
VQYARTVAGELDPLIAATLVAGVVLSMPLAARIRAAVVQGPGARRAALQGGLLVSYALVWFASILTVASSTHSPFLYFRF